MTSQLLDLPATAAVLALSVAAVLLAGATVRQLWAPAATAVGGALVLGQVVHAGAATAPVLCAVGAAIGLDQAFALQRQDRRLQRKLAARLPSRSRAGAGRSGGPQTATGHSVQLAGTAVIVSTAVLHFAVGQAVSAVPAGSPAIPVLAALSCLPALPALAGRLRSAAAERVPAVRARAGARMLSVPHDPRAGMVLAVIVFLWVALLLHANG